MGEKDQAGMRKTKEECHTSPVEQLRFSDADGVDRVDVSPRHYVTAGTNREVRRSRSDSHTNHASDQRSVGLSTKAVPVLVRNQSLILNWFSVFPTLEQKNSLLE